MSVIAAIEAATAAIELSTALSDAARRDRNGAPDYRRIIEALRGIYFTPRGTLRVLGSLSDGVRPAQEDVERVLTQFNDAEWDVRRHLGRLDFDRLAAFEGMSLRQRRVLGEIAYGKRELRRNIQEALNEALTYDRRVDPDETKVLLKRVEALNSMIESLEEEFL